MSDLEFFDPDQSAAIVERARGRRENPAVTLDALAVREWSNRTVALALIVPVAFVVIAWCLL